MSKRMIKRFLVLLLVCCTCAYGAAMTEIFPTKTIGSKGTGFRTFALAAAPTFDQEVADEAARLSLDPGTAVGWKVKDTDDGIIYTYNGPSTDSVAGAVDSPNGAVYKVDGTINGRNNYAGVSSANTISWDGTRQWVYSVAPTDAPSGDTTYPWEADWTGLTISSVTKDDVASPDNWTP